MNTNGKRNPQRRRNTQRVYYLVVLSALVTFLYCTTIVTQATQSYRHALEDGAESASRLSHILADHMELSFLGANLALRRAAEYHPRAADEQGDMERQFRAWLGETPQVAALALISRDGKPVASASKPGYEEWLGVSGGFMGDELFNYMRAGADDRYVFIGRQVAQGRKPLIIMSRRYLLPGGEFGGVVVAAIDPQYFVDFYQSVASGTEKYMALSMEDGTQLAEGPNPGEVPSQAIRAAVQSGAGKDGSAWVRTVSLSSGARIVGASGLRNLPLHTYVVLSRDDVLAAWRTARSRDIGFLVLFLTITAGLSVFSLAMARQINRAEESEAAAILASQAKSDFLANMSHELRTPLNAIIGFSEMMSSGYFGPLTPRQRERVHDINLCGTHLLQLISDILEFSKGDAGKLELAEEEVNIPDIVHECERMLSAKFRLKHIQFTTAVEVDMPRLYGDARKVRQVLLNLLSNAVKFTPDGGTIRVAALADAQGCINLMVSDSGVGIAEEDIPKALSVFGQAHRASSHEGTGLGLPLCKMYAELHGGKLILTSKQGQGTSVRVVFPKERTMAAKKLTAGATR